MWHPSILLVFIGNVIYVIYMGTIKEFFPNENPDKYNENHSV
jgi:hypothetical protein